MRLAGETLLAARVLAVLDRTAQVQLLLIYDAQVAPPVITALYGALNGILNIVLAASVSRARRTHGVSLGEGKAEQKALFVAIRAHGNNAEFVPLAIVMLLLAELCGGDPVALHVMGGLLLLGRIAHPIGLPRRAPNPFRFGGTALTWGVVVAAAGYTLYLRFQI